MPEIWLLIWQRLFIGKGFVLCRSTAVQKIGAGIGTDGGSCIYHGAAGGYEGGAALYRFAEGRGFCRLLPQIVSGKENALWVHTAGSIPMNIWQGHVARYGVLYPMQTFSKQREVDFGQIPCFVESNSEEDVQLLKDIASALSEKSV